MSISTTDEEPEAEVIDLEPTLHTVRPSRGPRSGSASFQPEAVMRGGGEPGQLRC